MARLDLQRSCKQRYHKRENDRYEVRGYAVTPHVVWGDYDASGGGGGGGGYSIIADASQTWVFSKYLSDLVAGPATFSTTLTYDQTVSTPNDNGFYAYQAAGNQTGAASATVTYTPPTATKSLTVSGAAPFYADVSTMRSLPANTTYNFSFTGPNTLLITNHPEIAMPIGKRLWLAAPNVTQPGNWNDGSFHPCALALESGMTRADIIQWIRMDPNTFSNAFYVGTNVATANQRLRGVLPASSVGTSQLAAFDGLTVNIKYDSGNSVYRASYDGFGFYPEKNTSYLHWQFHSTWACADGTSQAAVISANSQLVAADFPGTTVTTYYLTGTALTAVNLVKSDGTTPWTPAEVFAKKGQSVTLTRAGTVMKMA